MLCATQGAMQYENLVQQMQTQAESAQAVVHHVHHIEEVFTYTAALTQKQGNQTIAVYGFNEQGLASLRNQCATFNLRLITPPFRTHLTSIHTALTTADWGIAETGTLVLDSTSEDLRIATMLCETHVAVLEAANIKTDTAALSKPLNARLQSQTPSYTAFITGPSRTADIERVLAIGVHGPRHLHILILTESG